jgi:serine/threonine protein phosphatase PrpC
VLTAARAGCEAQVIGSDGLWDVMEPAAVLAACARFAPARDADGAARLLVDVAADLWPTRRSAVTVDDITAVVAFF